MSAVHTVAPVWAWVGFVSGVVALLALDLGLFHRKSTQVSVGEAAVWSAVWVALSACFGGWVALTYGAHRGVEFAAGYVLEKALAVDNLFVIALLFDHFRVPARYQHRVLYWGILGALVTRGIFIWLGATLIAKFSWVLYGFGALLVVAGAHVALQQEEKERPEGLIVRWVRKLLPVTKHLRGPAFWVVERSRLRATPLVLALVTIEVSDVVFAVDSIPAVFAVTRDPFIVFTSNICAVLGMRSLYFLLAHVIDRFRYLKFGLAAVLCFVGARLLLHRVLDIPTLVSLAVIVVLVGSAMLVSWLETALKVRRRPAPPPRRGIRPHRSGFRSNP
ncbi:MAG TPA: TerC family protein [Polyangiaceae bacterium]|jgi:tellurite resistance protein TerC|nr:TerC family protein [Polyangiaceae bacterium]